MESVILSVSQGHCEERSDEAIQSSPAAAGLLSSARNDGGGLRRSFALSFSPCTSFA